MKKVSILILLIFLTGSNLKCQVLPLLDSLHIFPNHPITADSITVTFKVFFDGYGAKKLAGALYTQSDSILYKGCYYCLCFNQSESQVNDTISLMPVAAGLYHLTVISRYATVYNDSLCVTDSPSWNGRIDTFFIVSTGTSIDMPQRYPFYAALSSFNELQIAAEREGELKASVYDIAGRTVSQGFKAFLHQGNNTVTLNLPSLPTGMYFYDLQIGDKQKVLKFVKE